MSAGKGDTPRKLNGDKFRDGWDRAFKSSMQPYQQAIVEGLMTRANHQRIFSAQPPAHDEKSAAKNSKTPRKSG